MAERLTTRLIWEAARDISSSPGGTPAGDTIACEERMTTFDKREDAFEAKYARDETLRFKAMARRNKALGLWAAAKLGLEGAEAEAYARSVVESDFDEAGDGDVYRKVKGDFDAKGIDISEHRLRRTMEELLAEAIQALKAAG